MATAKEPNRPELPLDSEAFGVLLSLASSFLTAMDHSKPQADSGRSGPKIDSSTPRSRYQILIDQLPAATFMAWYENGRCELYVSTYIETLLGYTARDWIENPTLWYERLHPEERDRWNKEFADTVLTARPFKGDYRFRARDGRVIWIHGEAKVINDEAGHPFIHGIGYDITALKQIEEDLLHSRDQERRANRAKSEFLTRTSHELRTPLTIIMGFAEYLTRGKAGPLNPVQMEYLQDIFNNGEHLLHLIEDILDLGLAESGKMRLASEKFSLRAVLNSVRDGAKAMAKQRKIHVDVVIAPEIDEVILDRQRFRQILYNLLSNAIKFTEVGGLVKIRVRPQGPDHFELVIKDTGIGIKREDLPRLFQDFEQLDSGSERRYEGCGLGLALTKRIVESQGGTISVESQHGVGSTFSVVLPKVASISSF